MYCCLPWAASGPVRLSPASRPLLWPAPFKGAFLGESCACQSTSLRPESDSNSICLFVLRTKSCLRQLSAPASKIRMCVPQHSTGKLAVSVATVAAYDLRGTFQRRSPLSLSERLKTPSACLICFLCRHQVYQQPLFKGSQQHWRMHRQLWHRVYLRLQPGVQMGQCQEVVHRWATHTLAAGCPNIGSTVQALTLPLVRATEQCSASAWALAVRSTKLPIDELGNGACCFKQFTTSWALFGFTYAHNQPCSELAPVTNLFCCAADYVRVAPDSSRAWMVGRRRQPTMTQASPNAERLMQAW